MDAETPAWKLAEAGQRLTRAARELLLGAAPADDERVARAKRLVDAALEEVAAARSDPAEGAKLVLHEPGALKYAPKPGEVARRMLPRAALAPSESPCRAGPPSAKHVLVLSGGEAAFATPDLIGFLSAQRKSGILEIETQDETFQLELAGGDVVHAQSDHTPEGQRLGDVLVEQGAIKRAKLEAVRARSGTHKLGAVLLEEGLVERDELLSALQAQIQHLFERLFEARVNAFAFWSGPPIHAEEDLRMNATSLLLEGARVADEKHRDAPSPAPAG